MAWTQEDQEVALQEGWGLFESTVSYYPLQLQKVDNPEDWDMPQHDFRVDTDAWEFVAEKANEGSELHVKALEALALESPGESASIRAWVGRGDAGIATARPLPTTEAEA